VKWTDPGGSGDVDRSVVPDFITCTRIVERDEEEGVGSGRVIVVIGEGEERIHWYNGEVAFRVIEERRVWRVDDMEGSTQSDQPVDAPSSPEL